jgi:surface antigen
MSDAGYGAANSTSYWRMYSGHNCTNYAAYRMVKSGLPNIRPWSGSGNASNWGPANPSITNAVPAVGAVAWWGANVPPAGSAGHVAYVEQVVSADEIVVSQDSWGGDFSWARITRSSGRWPSGFVHFNDVPMLNIVKPVISGLPKVGSPLTATPGTWNPADATLRVRWRADGVRIAGATGFTFTPTPVEEGKRITVRVTASKLGYPTTSVVSAATTAVLPGVLRNSVAPSISGPAQVDATLSASPGTWTPVPDALSYQWTADGATIDGATGPTLVEDAALVGKRVTVTVTASRPGFTDVSVTSPGTGPVAPGSFTVTRTASLSGSPRLGQILDLDEGALSPAGSDVTVQWLRGGVPVPGAEASTYQLTEEDLGHRMSARVSVARPGYTTLVETTPASAVVKSVPTVTALGQPGRGRVTFTVTVTAPGVSPVEGVVRIKSGGQVLKEVVLSGGKATTTVSGLPAGTRYFALRYAGSRTVATGVVRSSVKIG